MSIIWTIIIGFIAGVIAKFLIGGGNAFSGFVMTTLLGVIGAFVARFLFGALGFGPQIGLVGTTIGAIITLLIYGAFQRRRS